MTLRRGVIRRKTTGGWELGPDSSDKIRGDKRDPREKMLEDTKDMYIRLEPLPHNTMLRNGTTFVNFEPRPGLRVVAYFLPDVYHVRAVYLSEQEFSEEYHRLKHKAKKKGWMLPRTVMISEAGWTQYWRALEHNAQEIHKGTPAEQLSRPIPPHRSG